MYYLQSLRNKVFSESAIARQEVSSDLQNISQISTSLSIMIVVQMLFQGLGLLPAAALYLSYNTACFCRNLSQVAGNPSPYYSQNNSSPTLFSTLTKNNSNHSARTAYATNRLCQAKLQEKLLKDTIGFHWAARLFLYQPSFQGHVLGSS